MNNSSKGTLFETYENPNRINPEIGTWIDSYRIIKKLGEGTFGVVYQVSNKQNQIFALKLIKLWEVAFEKERIGIIKRFLREYEIGAFDSQYTVKSLDYGKIQGNPYLVMAFYEGGDLSAWINQPLDIQELNRIAFQILSGLQEIHRRGYFHRDIKPQNILLDINRNAKVADFGIAGHKTSQLTVKNIFGHNKQIFGTWAYIAPEQSNNKTAFKALDAVADIYSFGVMMYEVLTGQYPFPPYQITTDAELADYIENVGKGNALGLSKNAHKLPGNWAAIIKGCIELNHQNRFQSIQEIIPLLGYSSIDLVYPKHNSIVNDLIIQITYGEDIGKIYNLSQMLKEQKEGILTLGRKDRGIHNDIAIEESSTAYISRRHATIEKWDEPKQWIIRDGQFYNNEWILSVNQLFINSKLVDSFGVVIQPGDIITLGDTVIKVSVI